MKSDGFEDYVKEKTGLVIDSYFSATKLKWIIDNVEGVNSKLKKNNEKVFANPRNIAAGTIRQLDPKIASKRNLQIFIHGIIAVSYTHLTLPTKRIV